MLDFCGEHKSFFSYSLRQRAKVPAIFSLDNIKERCLLISWLLALKRRDCIHPVNAERTLTVLLPDHITIHGLNVVGIADSEK